MLVTAAAIAAAIGLTGCTSTPAPSPTTDDGKPIPTLTVTPTLTPGDLDNDGQVSAWESEQLTKTTYTLSDGKSVDVDPDEKLPKKVKKDIEEKVSDAVGKSPNLKSDLEGASDWQFELYDRLAEQEKLTGRTMIPVTYGYDGAANANRWCVGDPAAAGCFSSKASAVRAADAWVGDRVGKFAVLVIE